MGSIYGIQPLKLSEIYMPSKKISSLSKLTR